MSSFKFTVAVVAFVVTFIFSAGLVRIFVPEPVIKTVYRDRTQFVERNENAIEQFLRRDIRNDATRSSYGDSDEHPEAVMAYWKASSSMDDSEFPADFRAAWREHMKAWKNYGDYLSAAQRGKISEQKRERLNDEINRTWDDVLSIGRIYGSTLR